MQEILYPKIKDEEYVTNIDDKKVKEHIGFHYLLSKIQLYTLILLEFNIFLKYQTKSEIIQLHTLYSEFKKMNLLCADFLVSF